MSTKRFNPKPKIGMNANEIKFALHKMFAPPEWLSAEELFIPGHHRYVDFWTVCVFTPPKKGAYSTLGYKYLSTHSIEIKISKSDFKSEMQQPVKSKGAKAFSNYFSFAAPKGIIDIEELPPGIGYIEFRGSKGKFIKKPEHTHIESPGWNFVAALGRSLNKEKS